MRNSNRVSQPLQSVQQLSGDSSALFQINEDIDVNEVDDTDGERNIQQYQESLQVNNMNQHTRNQL